MKIVPEGAEETQVIGRVAQVAKTKGGLILGVSDQHNDTVMVLIESVGKAVTRYKAGDLVVPHHINHIYFRGGQEHRATFDQKEIIARVTDVPLDQLEVHGVSNSSAQSAEA